MNGYILIVDDESRYRRLYADVIEGAGFCVRTASSAEEAQKIIQDQIPVMVVTDVRMAGASGIDLLQKVRKIYADLPFLIVTAYADVRDAVGAMKLGAVDYLSKPVDLDELLTAIRDTLGLREGDGLFSEAFIPPEALDGIVAQSPAMKSLLWDAFRVANSDAGVLITGESGSGKEVLARFIHQNSGRKSHPMVILNCASVPAALLAGELFGHEKGAFTGAVEKRKGRFREAQGSTLFLDEIGDMPLELQPTLLRAIETGRITPLGSDREVAVDNRIIAATNRNLKDDIESGRFRRDLYYRLNVICIEIPPLRDRIEDILPLARFFLGRGRNGGNRLSRAAARQLCAYRWPGNVRELANTMERVRLLAQTDVILPEHLPLAIRQAVHSSEVAATSFPQASNSDAATVKTLEETEVEAIRQALKQTNGNRTRAADMLGITRRGLIYKLKRFGIA